MSKKEAGSPDFTSEKCQVMSERDLDNLKLAHSCTLEQALTLMEEELKTYAKPVYVFEKWCKGCNICIEFCPKQTLALSADFKAFQDKPDDCILCGLCELRCPDFSIFVVQKKKSNKN
jgi:2-oxoglutarate ferredoxin oxidoreductase subunit delta